MLLRFQYLALIMFRKFWGLTTDLANFSELGGLRRGKEILPSHDTN